MAIPFKKFDTYTDTDMQTTMHIQHRQTQTDRHCHHSKRWVDRQTDTKHQAGSGELRVNSTPVLGLFLEPCLRSAVAISAAAC